MKLHALEITGMGPYADRVEIDFDRLDEAGVYLLTGPTGSGKTTVLDAISYALFGAIPRAAKGSEVVSDHRALTTTPAVRLEATVGGQRLRVTRIPEHERPKAKGEGNTTEKQALTVEVRQADEWRMVTGNWSEGNAELESRVGMNADQFGQVVMLPQGEFARFLQAGARERQELLESLFPGADLTWLEDWLKHRAASDLSAHDTKADQVEACFQAIRPIAATLVGEDEEPLPELAESRPALKWIARTETDLAGIHAERKRALEQAVTKAEAAAAELKRLSARKERIRERGIAEARKEELGARADWRRALGEEIAAAEKASPVLILVRAAEDQKRRAATATVELRELERRVEEDDLTRDLDPEQRPDREKSFRDEITTIRNFERDELPRRRQLTEQVAELEKELAGLQDEGPDSPVGRAAAAVREAEDRVAATKKQLIEIRDARTRGMAAELAATLVEGEPCAVCGSTEHPSPAHGEGPRYTPEDEQRADREVTAAEDAAETAREELGEVKTETGARKATVESQLTAAKNDLGKLEERERGLAASATTIGERRDRLERAAELLANLLESERRAGEAREVAAGAEVKAAGEAASREFDSVEAAMAAAREETELAELRSQAEHHDKELAIVDERLEKRLAGVDASEEIDLEPTSTLATETAAQRDEQSSAAGVAGNRLETFRAEMSKVPDLYEQLRPLREAADVSSELDRLAGGKNERKMKLSIYVLATRLRQVIEAANRHLQQMSNQRYELLYSGDKKGNAMAGLGIEVFDAYTSETRPTSTLSGGESFYASLSLALALAEIVQQESGGKGLETLFIDEGFGTLDAKSLDQVMDVIDSLRAGGRSVGLVSHVEELRNRIPAQIQVEGGRNGSSLEVTT